MISEKYSKKNCEYLRKQAKERFQKVQATWLTLGRWGRPHRIKWLASQIEGERNDHHITDISHILALRSYVAGFSEGNTSTTRPWYRSGTGDRDRDLWPEHSNYLYLANQKSLQALSRSNFYHAATQAYYDYGVFNTTCYYIDELPDRLHWHVLVPGSYYVLNDALGEAAVLIREFELDVKQLVDTYGTKENGKWNWDDFSPGVRKHYEEGNYTEKVVLVHLVMRNEYYNAEDVTAGSNRPWVSMVYELGGDKDYVDVERSHGSITTYTSPEDNKFIKISHAKRKPFIVAKSQSNHNFEYGETGPTLDALGLIKSLNKKAMSKDQALEQMLSPTIQGPANLNKSYLTTAPGKYIPMDPFTLSKGGAKKVYDINPAFGALVQDTQELRSDIDKIYYADFLLYLSRNPKTRTAAETNAVVNEQQSILGPNLQSLNFTHNIPIYDYVMDYTLDTDPDIPEPPEGIAGRFLRPEFISVFAQAQRAADLPAIERYMAMVANVGQINPDVFHKANLDRLANLYEDRLYLPPGLNRSDEEAEASRQRAIAAQERQQQMEQIALAAKAAKDVGIKANQGESNE